MAAAPNGADGGDEGVAGVGATGRSTAVWGVRDGCARSSSTSGSGTRSRISSSPPLGGTAGAEQLAQLFALPLGDRVGLDEKLQQCVRSDALIALGLGAHCRARSTSMTCAPLERVDKLFSRHAGGSAPITIGLAGSEILLIDDFESKRLPVANDGKDRLTNLIGIAARVAFLFERVQHVFDFVRVEQ